MQELSPCPAAGQMQARQRPHSRFNVDSTMRPSHSVSPATTLALTLLMAAAPGSMAQRYSRLRPAVGQAQLRQQQQPAGVVQARAEPQPQRRAPA